jgi:hypothetical protein
MTLNDYVAIYAALLSTILAVTNLIGWLNDRHKLSLAAKFIPEANCYIIEVVNDGNKEITLTGAGITRFPESALSGSQPKSWAVREALPARLQSKDSIYLSVPWNEDFGNQLPNYVWVRDAHRQTYQVGLPKSNPPLCVNPVGILDQSALAQLYNLNVHLEEARKNLARLGILDLQVDIVRQRFLMELEDADRAIQEKLKK